MTELEPDPAQFSDLEQTAKTIQARGYIVRRVGYFAPSGLAAFGSTSTVEIGSGEPYGKEHIQILENGVFLHPRGTSWEARITWHGGPHWTKAAATLDELAEIALRVLSGDDKPPQGWTKED